MSLSNDNIMERGMVQAIFNYLPNAHIDFYVRSKRVSYSAKVTYWRTQELEDINNIRVCEIVQENLNSFLAAGGQAKGFPDHLEKGNCTIQKPSINLSGTINSRIDPLTFACQKCRRVYEFTTRDEYEQKVAVEHECCKSNLRQLMFVFPCECGYCGSIKKIKCQKHPDSDIFYDPNNYVYICSDGACRIEIKTKCPECSKILFPHAALDRSNLIAANTTIIDLYNSNVEQFIANATFGNQVVMSKWIGKTSSEEFERIVSGAEDKNFEEEQLLLRAAIDEYTKMGFDETTAEEFARTQLMSEGKQSLIGSIKTSMDTSLSIANEAQFTKASGQVLEYERVVSSDSICTLDEAKSIAASVKNSLDLTEYDSLMNKMGFKDVLYSDNIPFVLISYGYTRKMDDPADAKPTSPLTLRAFRKKDSDVIDLYSVKMETEGILFELNKPKIIDWLLRNHVIDPVAAPDTNDDNDMKRWFVNNVDMTALSKFANIDANRLKTTAYVYKLVHSISHMLIRKIGICGLDINSVGEYLLPNIPSFIIYCKNTGGISIGAIASLFKIHLTDWLSSAYNDVGSCIADPICIDRDKACNGCLLLPTTSCQHMNKDLDRSYLCGYTDIDPSLAISGFWI